MRGLIILLVMLSWSARAEVPWPVLDGSACRVCVTVADYTAWTFGPALGGVPVLRGAGAVYSGLWVIVPAGEYAYTGSSNWTCSLLAGHTCYVGVDTGGNGILHDDDTMGRKAARLSMTIYGFTMFAGFWLVGLMLRMLPRQPNVGDI